MTTQLLITPSAFQAGDAAVVRRGSAPATVTLGTAATAGIGDFAAASHDHQLGDISGLVAELESKQALLVSGENIKTINGVNILGSGNLVIEGGGSGGTPTWGGIAGVLADQTDLASALAGKADTSHGHDNATTEAAGFMAAADKAKLTAIEAGATATAGTVTSVAATGANGVTVTGGPVTSSGTLAISGPDPISEAAAGIGTNTGIRSWSSFLVRLNVTGWWDTVSAAALRSKAELPTAAQLRDRATHTGAQAISTVTGLQDALDGKAEIDFASRAEAIAATVPEPVQRITVMQAGGALSYRADAAGTALATNGGTRTWAPDGIVYPDHWGENTTPGTTDMTAALQAAMSWANEVRLRPVQYRVTDTIRTYARNGKRLIGEGEASRIVVAGGSFDVLRFYTGETNPSGVPLSCLGVELHDFRIQSIGAQRTGGWYVTFEERPLGARLSGLLFEGPFNGIELPMAAYCYLDNIRITGTGRTTNGGTALSFTGRSTAGIFNPNSNGSGTAKSTDCHISDLQINPETSISAVWEQAILIESGDGLYFDKGHIRGATNCLVMRTAEETVKSVVASISFDQMYFDTAIGSHIQFQGYGQGHQFTDPEGSTPVTVKFRAIAFYGCQFRDSRGTDGSITASNMTAGAVDRISFHGGIIRDNTRSGIRDVGASSGFRGLTVSGIEMSGNNTAGSADHGDIVLRDNGHSIANCEFKPGDANTDVGYAIRVLAAGASDTAGLAVVRNNNLTNSPISLARRLDLVAGVRQFGNAGAGTLLTGGDAAAIVHDWRDTGDETLGAALTDLQVFASDVTPRLQVAEEDIVLLSDTRPYYADLAWNAARPAAASVIWPQGRPQSQAVADGTLTLGLTSPPTNFQTGDIWAAPATDDFDVDLTGNVTLAPLVLSSGDALGNDEKGRTGIITFAQDGTGGRTVAVGSVYSLKTGELLSGGLLPLDTDPGAETDVVYRIRKVGASAEILLYVDD